MKSKDCSFKSVKGNGELTRINFLRYALQTGASHYRRPFLEQSVADRFYISMLDKSRSRVATLNRGCWYCVWLSITDRFPINCNSRLGSERMCAKSNMWRHASLRNANILSLNHTVSCINKSCRICPEKI